MNSNEGLTNSKIKTKLQKGENMPRNQGDQDKFWEQLFPKNKHTYVHKGPVFVSILDCKLPDEMVKTKHPEIVFQWIYGHSLTEASKCEIYIRLYNWETGKFDILHVKCPFGRFVEFVRAKHGDNYQNCHFAIPRIDYQW
jgi:hypothetical protein